MERMFLDKGVALNLDGPPEREDHAILGAGFSACITVTFDGKPTYRWVVSRLDSDSDRRWGLDSWFDGWIDNPEHLSCPRFMNGFGSMGVSQKVLSQRACDWLNSIVDGAERAAAARADFLERQQALFPETGGSD